LRLADVQQTSGFLEGKLDRDRHSFQEGGRRFRLGMKRVSKILNLIEALATWLARSTSLVAHVSRGVALLTKYSSDP